MGPCWLIRRHSHICRTFDKTVVPHAVWDPNCTELVSQWLGFHQNSTENCSWTFLGFHQWSWPLQLLAFGTILRPWSSLTFIVCLAGDRDLNKSFVYDLFSFWFASRVRCVKQCGYQSDTFDHSGCLPVYIASEPLAVLLVISFSFCTCSFLSRVMGPFAWRSLRCYIFRFFCVLLPALVDSP